MNTPTPTPALPFGNVLIRRKGWHNWQEAGTLIKTTKNGWRIRWETGLWTGMTRNLTKRNWEVCALSELVGALSTPPAPNPNRAR